MSTPRFTYGVAALRNFSVRTCEQRGKTVVEGVELDGEPLNPSARFWNSLQVRFGFTHNIFKYFRHDEVFQRISEKAPNDALRWCIERNGGTGTLLAVTGPRTATATYDDLTDLFGDGRAEKLAYHNGVVRSTHTPRFAGPFAIAGDDFSSKFVIDTPIDGFGRPAIYLALLRQVCSNGAVAVTPVFRSEINVGKGGDTVQFALSRAVEGFNNEEGFAALRQRFEAATQSWSSVAEVQRLYKILVKLHAHKQLDGRAPVKAKGGDGASELDGSPLFHAFHRMTGDLTRLYGLANIDALSGKRQRTLPTACRVYDLLNFASELATHHATTEGGKQMQVFIGSLVSAEYDLEGTAEQYADWRDFFVETFDK